MWKMIVIPNNYITQSEGHYLFQSNQNIQCSRHTDPLYSNWLWSHLLKVLWQRKANSERRNKRNLHFEGHFERSEVRSHSNRMPLPEGGDQPGKGWAEMLSTIFVCVNFSIVCYCVRLSKDTVHSVLVKN